MGTYTGTPPTFAALAALPASTLNAHLRDFITAFGAWNSYTPTVAQGTSTDISKTLAYSKYIQVNKTVVVRVMLTASGAGQSGQPITVTYPVTPSYTGSSFIAFGTGVVRDGSVEYVALVGSGTDGATFRRADANSGGQIGEDPAFALASGDVISFSAIYEAA